MVPTQFPGLRVLAGALLLVASCATAPRTSASPPRMKDSAPERVAAQRTAGPHSLQLEQDEGRWGFEAARERRRQQDAEKARKAAAFGDKSVDVRPPAK